MRERTVKRYYCDFCKKAGFQKNAMIKHETHCTMNPNRKCRMCVFVSGSSQPNLTQEDARAIFKPMPAIMSESQHADWLRQAAEGIAVLRARTENCPACILAALRAADVPVPLMSDHFDFSKECANLWSEVNEERMCESPYY
jgi:hypothetical protein